MTIAEQLGKLIGESLVRGAEKENERKVTLLLVYMNLIALELELFLDSRNNVSP